MKLIHKMIPEQFLYSLPEGLKFINKNGKEYLVVEELTCPKGHSLIANSVQIHGESSVKIIVKVSHQEGPVFIDAYWGSHAKLFSFIPEEGHRHDIVDVKCPTCGISLISQYECSIEGCHSTKAVQFHLPGKKNKIYVCARLGCPGHKIDITEMPHSVSDKISGINFFGSHDDNFFEGI